MESVRSRRPGSSPEQVSEEEPTNTWGIAEVISRQDSITAFNVILRALTHVIDAIFNTIERSSKSLAPHHPEILWQAVYGILLCFFGGVFMTLLAATEAVRLYGSDKIATALVRLHAEWERAQQAIQRDKVTLKERNNHKNAMQIDGGDISAMRFELLCRNVDPENLSMALEGLGQASMAVLATMRIQFTRAVTLGTAIGDEMQQRVGAKISRFLRAALPVNYNRWVPVLSRYWTRSVGIFLSWMMVRVTASVYSANKGSTMLIKAITGYLVICGHVKEEAVRKNEWLLSMAGAGLAFLGVVSQMSSGFRISFPINILLFPLTMAETILAVLVGSSKV